MKVTLLCLLAPAAAFVTVPVQTSSAPASAAVSGTRLYGYVPDGLTPEQWAKLKKKEADDAKKKNFGAGGARGFKSRSMQSFMLAYERGEAKHLFPVDPQKVREGKIALRDVPYMQRGGSWDNSDLTNAKKGWMTTGFGMTAYNDGKAKENKKNRFDDKYNALKPSISIFGGDSINWGSGAKNDRLTERAKKNGISNDQQMWRDAGALTPEEARRRRGGAPKLGQPEKKFFGLF